MTYKNYRDGNWEYCLWDFRENEYLDDPDEDIHCVLASKGEAAANRQESYDNYLETDYWQKVRQQALIRFDSKCQQCGSTEKLQVHHKAYPKRYTELDNMHLLQVLCEQCHHDEHR